jgi:DNA ligase-1
MTPPLPMLAHDWNERSHSIREPFYTQPKLDGVRLVAGNSGMISRTGKEVKSLDHLIPFIEQLGLTDDEFLDGEVLAPGKTFEEVAGLFRSGRNCPELEFYIFDLVDTSQPLLTFERRMERLRSFQLTNPLHLVPFRKVVKKSMITDINNEYLGQGYEGTIIRNIAGFYKIGARHVDLQKFKLMKTDEFKIVGAEEGKGKDKETVIWVCETQTGTQFWVRPKGTHEQRRDWFMAKNRWTTGRHWLTVQYQNLIEKSGVPRFPIGLTIRDYE